MNDREFFIKSIINEMQHTIDSLYITCNSCAKNMLLNSLRKNVSDLSILVQSPQDETQVSTAATNSRQSNQLRAFTQAELSNYNGKSGNPAYVAVNGTVYDVTNNAAWAAATHFGLTSGRDLTREFASCHSGQPILSRLKAVGKIV
jgi:predicted heme/steroid binding protein